MEFDKPVIGGPCWAELGASDLRAAKLFYGEVFGWQCGEPDPRPELRGYTVARLADAAVAGLGPLYRPTQPVAWNVSFAVSDADAVTNKVVQAGGTVIRGPMDIFDEGRRTVALDPSGAAFQLWQAREFAGAQVFNRPGALGWVELATRDVKRARAFYETVFGWSVNTSEWYTQWGMHGMDFGGVTALHHRFPVDVPPHWLPYFAVEDVDATTEVAVRAGGRALQEPTNVEGGPRLAVLRDGQGAAFGIYQTEEEQDEQDEAQQEAGTGERHG
ncbi:VOC family protein [Streptomyces thermodiastaticus]|jgi:predicted enzyme related to lactoylglutathione lyase|uniref:VOC family protein n=1 Tax=Streptomyces thermodiastaticus TaxID=44061 RepID=UPI001679D0C0|nr:VOC family protein [Streptomyces thermodiastaticus]MCE7549503.1 VOC family protein [Streptomyces thermodiastaticus]